MRRVFICLFSALIAGLVLASPAAAQAPPAVQADFNADGFADLAAGVPQEDVGGQQDAGAVQVIYGGSNGLRSAGNQLWHQDVSGIADTAEGFDRFGDALAAGDFNDDGFADLAIGVPQEDVNGQEEAGAVQLIYGGSTGLRRAGNQLWHQDVSGIVDTAGIDDRFGAAIASGDFDNDGIADLAVGVPGERVQGLSRHDGAVHVLYGTSAGLARADDQFWHQDVPGMADDAGSESGDEFGSALATGDFDNDGFDDLAVGIPTEQDETFTTTHGAVHLIYGASGGLAVAGNQFWHQDVGGILDSGESVDLFGAAVAAGDFNNDGFDDLAVGVPREDVGTVEHAGAAHVIYGSAAGLTNAGDQLWHQDVGGIFDSAEQEDRFGTALTTGDFDSDGSDDLVAGVPEEAVGTVADAGAAHLIYGSTAGLTAPGNELWHQDVPTVGDTAEQEDRFGEALASGDFDADSFDDLAAGVRGEGVGDVVRAGAAHALYGSSAGLSGDADQLWHQDVPGIVDTAEFGDEFGSALTSGAAVPAGAF